MMHPLLHSWSVRFPSTFELLASLRLNCFVLALIWGFLPSLVNGQQGKGNSGSNGVARIHDKDFESLPGADNSRFLPIQGNSQTQPFRGSSFVAPRISPPTFNPGTTGGQEISKRILTPETVEKTVTAEKPIPAERNQEKSEDRSKSPTAGLLDSSETRNAIGETQADKKPPENSPKQLPDKVPGEPPSADTEENRVEKTDKPTGEEPSEEDEASTALDAADKSWSVKSLTDRKTLPSTIQMIISVAALSLVPAILLMTTCFIRIVVVLGILRQAIGLQQLPPTQVTTALALMLTFLIMTPTWKQVKQDAIDPYSAEGSTMTWDDAWQKGVTPIKKFMWHQIERAENEKDFWIFYDYLPEEDRSKEPTSIEEVPLQALLPAFMISELKVAFLIGVQILLPFLILDIVIASLCNTMGLIMMPPTVVSLPLKLLLFVMVDGWNLIVTMLLESFSQVV